MKIRQLLIVALIAAANFSFACNSLLKSFPAPGVTSQQTDLIKLLPSSDVVMKINSKRLFNDSIPQLLSFVPEAAAKYNEQLKELQGRSGIDPQSVNEVVVGWSYKSQKPNNFNGVDFVAVARGDFDSNALLEKSKQSAKGKVREETVNDKTVYIIDLPVDADKQNGSTEILEKNSFAETAITDRFKFDQVAMVAIDANTIAFSKPAQIRSILNGNKTPVNPVLIELLNRYPDAAVNFAVDASFQQNLMSSSLGNQATAGAPKIRECLVSLDFDSNGLLMNLAAITPQEEEAKKLEDSFAQMQTSFKQIFGKATDETSQVVARTIDNFKLTRNATEVQFEARIPKNDLEKMFKGYVALLSSMIMAPQSRSAKPVNPPPPPPAPARKSLLNE